MRRVGVIPSRYESSRLPGKPLIELGGHPMIWWVYNRAKSANGLDDVICAVDDELVFEYCKKENITAMMTSKDHSNGTERVIEVAEKVDADEYVQIQGDEPLVEPRVIEEVIKLLGANKETMCAMLKTPFQSPVDVVDTTTAKIVTDINGFALMITRQPIPYPKGMADYVFWDPLGTVGWKREMLLKFKSLAVGPIEKAEDIEFIRVIENGYKIKVGEIYDYKCIEINTRKDLVSIDNYIKEHEVLI